MFPRQSWKHGSKEQQHDNGLAQADDGFRGELWEQECGMTTRAEADAMALQYINQRGSDCVGVIDSDEKFAAALIYVSLHREGLLVSTPTKDGPEYRLTPAGVAALRVQ